MLLYFCLLALGYGADRSEIDPAVRLETALDYLLRYSAFETLEAIVFMLAWCDEIGDEIAWTTICGRYRKALPNMLFEGIPEHHHPLLDAIDDHLRGGGNVYAHCWGGKGRTGTVVGCWLIRHGYGRSDFPDDPIGPDDPDDVIAVLDDMRRGDLGAGDQPSPDTADQEAFIRSWEPGM